MGNIYNSITGGNATGPVIQAGNVGGLDFGADGSVTVNGRRVAGSEPKATPSAVPSLAELWEKIDTDGPRLSLLTEGEAGAIFTLLALVAAASEEAAPLAKELTHRVRARLAEHNKPTV
jgi:hypothetical protein